MPPIVVPSASEATLLGSMLGVATPNNQSLRLFVNDQTPADGHVAADYTEMSTHGYAAKTLTKTSWVPAAGASGQPATATYAQQTWTFTAAAPVTVYGYYVVDATSGLLLWAERFSSPKVVQNTGDQILITPAITLSRV